MNFRLDPSRQQLTCSGSLVPLKARAFDLLVYFAEHAGELIDKAAVMRAVWPNVVVEENNLSQHLSVLRHALGEGRHGRQFIVTVPRRGFRFVAEVRQVNGSKSPATGTAEATVQRAQRRRADPGDGAADRCGERLSVLVAKLRTRVLRHLQAAG